MANVEVIDLSRPLVELIRHVLVHDYDGLDVRARGGVRQPAGHPGERRDYSQPHGRLGRRGSWRRDRRPPWRSGRP